ncbi:MAG: hypothetical protein VB067_02130 [Christensenellaceae bacterium]|nr:hypothetical protein [Christensenellaceae bacterium]MEA5065145.1 hypothetical protein [Eubacteriales bacterium]MEA5067762.1 hypothetical protein [Christensenellaceae bacterium]
MGQHKSWSRLDNAAKIFPPTSSRRSTKVFRLVCVLNEPVDKDTLQRALERAVDAFPLYRSVLKKGLFWYYFEDSDIRAQVQEECLPVCSPLYNVDRHGLLFRVSYFGQRINLEVFHSLADGSGALRFLRGMIHHYLALKHGLTGHLADDEPARDQVDQDAFYQYYDKSGAIPKQDHCKAYRIRGERYPRNALSITEGLMSARAALDRAHEHRASLSEFLVAHLICAILDGMAVRDRQRPIVITVPVDLRRFFPAQTARNFFGLMLVKIDACKEIPDFERVLDIVRESFERQLSRDNLSIAISRYSAIENNPFIKAIPLQLKIPILRLAGLRSDRGDTAGFSNVGRVVMPEEDARYIRMFGVYFSAKRPQVCVCSFGDTLAISMSSPLMDTAVQRRFFRALTSLGIDVQVISNLP